MRNETVIITRSQVGQWLSYAGGIGLITGFIGLIWQTGFTPFIIAALAIGVLGILGWAMIAPADFRAFFAGRQTRYGTSAVFGTLLIIGIVVLSYVLLQRQTITIDMTQSGRFTISPETRRILSRIARPIRITGFYSSALLSQRDIDDQFYRQYEIESNGTLSREYVNPDEQPAIAQRFGMEFDGQVFVSFLNEDGTVDFDTVSRVPRSNTQEADMTAAILRLLVTGNFTVYFETSKGGLDPLDNCQQCLSGATNGIRESGLVPLPISITEIAATGQDIPPVGSTIILARPTTDFTQAEIAVLDRYLQQGGSLFIMADVLYNEDGFLREDGLFNQYLWANYGIRALDAVAVDPASSAETPLDVVSFAVFENNSITQRMNEQNLPSVFRLSRVVEANVTPPLDVTTGAAIMSSPDGFGERNLEALSQTNTYALEAEQDVAGPVATVVWANNSRTGARIALVGDADFATNGFVATGGNALLFTDIISWLTRFGESVSFAPQIYQTGLPVMFISGQELDVIAFLTTFLLPGVILGLGVIIWFRRARA
jgi:ABC-type uncharacterized transport system involved in gliding motility auxiliary subunit